MSEMPASCPVLALPRYRCKGLVDYSFKLEGYTDATTYSNDLEILRFVIRGQLNQPLLY